MTTEADETLEGLLRDIRACRVCAHAMRHEPRPIVVATPSARILIAGQAPGARVQASGIPFDDPSGDRLRDWMGLDRAAFYDSRIIAFAPTGFCFPGNDAKGGDLPPRKECVPLWRNRLMAKLTGITLTLLVGGYAQTIALGARAKGGLTLTVVNWAAFAPSVFVLPHPSWRNTAWLKKNPWFETEVIPALRAAISHARGQ